MPSTSQETLFTGTASPVTGKENLQACYFSVSSFSS